MKIVYSTGPVENAASNPSTSTWVKVMNLSESLEIVVEVKVYRLNGQKAEIAYSTFTIFPLSSDFDVFEINDILQYEVQISVSNKENALVSVWGKDANANLVSAHRFVQKELNIISNSPSPTNLSRPVKKKKSTNSSRRKVRRN
ncbi:MAG TPA: hypothetical protein VFC73_02820 [Syntrophomonadaceae bacterium]|nr:hypothetical protein [Syntrophomonadaceae bacterium]